VNVKWAYVFVDIYSHEWANWRKRWYINEMSCVDLDCDSLINWTKAALSGVWLNSNTYLCEAEARRRKFRCGCGKSCCLRRRLRRQQLFPQPHLNFLLLASASQRYVLLFNQTPLKAAFVQFINESQSRSTHDISFIYQRFLQLAHSCE